MVIGFFKKKWNGSQKTGNSQFLVILGDQYEGYT